MGRRRGFFAELQYQAAKAQKERARQVAAAERERRRLEQEMRRAHDAAVAAQQRADAQAAAEAEREAKQRHLEAQLAKAAFINTDLQTELAAIDSVLESTLAVDDYVDLEKLRRVVKHPPFKSAHMRPQPPPAPIPTPPEPYFQPPPPPAGISAVFAKKKHQAATAAAWAQFEQVHAAWRATVSQIPQQQAAAFDTHQSAEFERLRNLARDRKRYDHECEERQRAADVANAQLDDLINRFANGEQAAVDEYIERFSSCGDLVVL